MTKSFEPPFQFDLTPLHKRAVRLARKHVTGASINLPFLSVSVSPDDLESRVAREVVIRLSDRRVLNAWECCDDCIDRAIHSLQEIRQMLLDKKVELSAFSDGPLFLILDYMLDAIRQFITFEESLSSRPETPGVRPGYDREKFQFNKHEYFAALEMLRAHLHRCLQQVAAVAGLERTAVTANLKYDHVWQLEAYVRPELPENTTESE